MFGLVIVIANVGGLYFYFQDKKGKAEFNLQMQQNSD